jgi:hypothetical protein
MKELIDDGEVERDDRSMREALKAREALADEGFQRLMSRLAQAA